MCSFPCAVCSAHQALRQKTKQSHWEPSKIRKYFHKGMWKDSWRWIFTFHFVYYLLPCQPPLEYHNSNSTSTWKEAWNDFLAMTLNLIWSSESVLPPVVLVELAPLHKHKSVFPPTTELSQPCMMEIEYNWMYIRWKLQDPRRDIVIIVEISVTNRINERKIRFVLLTLVSSWGKQL